jgi:diguanylate cyclase (GGDEF)-like protein
MNKNSNLQNEKNNSNIEKTLQRLTTRHTSSAGWFYVLLVLYLVTSFIVRTMSHSQATIPLFGTEMPANTFAGMFSSVANICVIFMAVYHGKKGYYTAITLLTIHIPFILIGVIRSHNLNSLPGIFGNLLTIMAISVIFVNNNKMLESEKKLRNQAVTDGLTGLPNSFACTEILNDLVRKNEPFALVSIDINDFKSINDTMGFNMGNAVLKEISTRWKTIADSGISGTLDFITRISGDEFMLIIRDYHSPEDIRLTVEQYESVLRNRLTIEDFDFYITASFGYAEFPKDAQTRDAALSYANAAMNEVKRANSSNRILHFTPDLLKLEHTLEIEGKIRAALDNDTIFFHLQPQFDMSHKLRGFEALARMKDENGSFISPGEFIPTAEKVGLIDKVDGTVFRKAAVFFGDLIRKSNADFMLSINVSVRHLMKNDFLDEIRETLRVSGIPADHLEIEITESIMIDSAEKALNCINELKKMGIQLAIDDFGTGYSSLSYLNSFPANLLKIDKSFIDKMNTSDSSKQYVAAIISIGHIMGFHVISEGVEETAQLETLRSIGCDYIQGYLWGRPLPQEEAEKLVMESVS